MKFYWNNNKSKTTIIFIHGFGKSYNDFNITEHGKNINIEKKLSKHYNTLCVQIEYDDYKLSIPDLSNLIYAYLFNLDPELLNDDQSSKQNQQSNKDSQSNNDANNILNTKIIIVAHSYGGFIGLYLSETYFRIFKKLFLIDPSVKSDDFLKYLMTDTHELNTYKIKNFDLLPDGLSIKSSVIIRIHFNLNTKDTSYDEFISDVAYFSKLVNKNTKSRLVLHANKSHMIHYSIPDTIFDAIQELCKL
jgi:predicted esterase